MNLLLEGLMLTAGGHPRHTHIMLWFVCQAETGSPVLGFIKKIIPSMRRHAQDDIDTHACVAILFASIGHARIEGDFHHLKSAIAEVSE